MAITAKPVLNDRNIPIFFPASSLETLLKSSAIISTIAVYKSDPAAIVFAAP